MKSMKRTISIICVVAFTLFSLSGFMFAATNSAGKHYTSFTIAKKAIKIDGKFSDWSSVAAIPFDTEIRSGKPLLVKGSTVKFAWNGGKTLYVYAVVHVSPARAKLLPKSTTSNWYDYDVFEVFLQNTVPATSIKNKQTAYHYGFSDKYKVKGLKIAGDNAKGLEGDATAKFGGYNSKTHSYTVEAAIPLKGTISLNMATGKAVYIAAGIECNSAGEFTMAGKNVGVGASEFWAPSNLTKVVFKK